MRRLILATTMTALLGACGSPEPSAPAVPVPSPLSDAQRATALAALPAPYNQADLANGEATFARCRSCHTMAAGGSNMTGPNLYGIIGRVAGTREGYHYSTPLKGAGFAWDQARLDQWLTSPRALVPGTKMSFPGLPDATDRRDVVAYLSVEAAKR
ncbi:cytochrome c family protein [soil metagenome]